MIVLNTSALMAVILHEPLADRCIDAMAIAPSLAISAATVAEALVVADRKRRGDGMRQLLAKTAPEIVPVTDDHAIWVAEAYSMWGKGVHPARLNLGDCFSYALAKQRACLLLFVGHDFSRTDVASAL